MSLSTILGFAAFLALVFFVAMSGAIFKPGPWYQTLDKPSWTPPNWLFPVVWSALYVMIALAGWRVYQEAGLVVLPFAIYLLQLALNAAWSALFFGMRRADLAYVDVVALWIAVAVNIALFYPIDPVAGWLLVPYLVWVTIASCLNFSVWRRNKDRFSTA